VLRYVYIDRAWEKPDRLGFFIERIKYALLATFGSDAVCAIRAPASGRFAIGLPGRRCDRLS
jgi:hypothetical protein